MDTGISALLSALGGQSQEAARGKQETGDSYAKILEAVQQTKTAIQEAGNAEYTIKKETTTKERQTNENIERFATALGANLGAQNEILTALGIESQEKFREAQAARQDATFATREVQRRKEVGLLDNPLQYLANQIQMPDFEAAATSATATANSLEEEAKALHARQMQINAAVTSTAQTQEAIKNDMTEARQLAELSLVKAGTDKKLAEAAITGEGHRIQKIQNMARLTEIQVGAQAKAFDAQRAQEQMAMARESHAMQMKNLRAAAAERAEEPEFKKAALAAGAKKIGFTLPKELEGITNPKILDAAIKTSKELEMAYNVGVPVLLGAGTDKLFAGPADLVAAQMTMPQMNFIKDPKMRDLYAQSKQMAEQTAAATGKKVPFEVQVARIAADMNQKIKNIQMTTPESEMNPLRIVDPATLVSAVPALKGNLYVQKAALLGGNATPTQILNSIIEDTKAGKVNPSIAAKALKEYGVMSYEFRINSKDIATNGVPTGGAGTFVTSPDGTVIDMTDLTNNTDMLLGKKSMYEKFRSFAGADTVKYDAMVSPLSAQSAVLSYILPEPGKGVDEARSAALQDSEAKYAEAQRLAQIQAAKRRKINLNTEGEK